jgi:hypothetical protein
LLSEFVHGDIWWQHPYPPQNQVSADKAAPQDLGTSVNGGATWGHPAVD